MESKGTWQGRKRKALKSIYAKSEEKRIIKLLLLTRTEISLIYYISNTNDLILNIN